MTGNAKRGLGRSFDSLISNDFDKSLLLTNDERIERIPVDQLIPNPDQPRKTFDETALSELSASIKEHGVFQPLIANPLKDGKYTLIAGERRLRASQLAGLKDVPIIIRSTEKQHRLELALLENVQRVDLSPLEEALSIERLHVQFNIPYEEIAKRLGKANSTVNNTVRLLKLPKEAHNALAAGQISEGHARAILSLKDDTVRQKYLLDSIIEHGWSVRQAERFVTSVKHGVKEVKKAHQRTASETPATKNFS